MDNTYFAVLWKYDSSNKLLHKWTKIKIDFWSDRTKLTRPQQMLWWISYFCKYLLRLFILHVFRFTWNSSWFFYAFIGFMFHVWEHLHIKYHIMPLWAESFSCFYCCLVPNVDCFSHFIWNIIGRGIRIGWYRHSFFLLRLKIIQ